MDTIIGEIFVLILLVAAIFYGLYGPLIRIMMMKKLAKQYGLQFNRREDKKFHVMTGSIKNHSIEVYDYKLETLIGRSPDKTTVIKIDDQDRKIDGNWQGYAPVHKIESLLAGLV